MRAWLGSYGRLLLGCARRRSELAALDCGAHQRDGFWVFVDLLPPGH